MRLPGIIAIEGIDASGKATQAKMLADYLDARPDPYPDLAKKEPLQPCLRLAFPNYQTPIGALIASKLKGEWDALTPGDITGPEDRSALVLQSLMIANKFELADEIERANVVEGRNVVLDRYVVSGLAYGQADGLPLEFLERLHARLPKAHHVFIDIPVEESFKRRPKRDDAYESNVERLRTARINYLAYFESKGVNTEHWEAERDERVQQGFRNAPSGWAIINGMGDVDTVHARIITALEL